MLVKILQILHTQSYHNTNDYTIARLLTIQWDLGIRFKQHKNSTPKHKTNVSLWNDQLFNITGA